MMAGNNALARIVNVVFMGPPPRQPMLACRHLIVDKTDIFAQYSDSARISALRLLVLLFLTDGCRLKVILAAVRNAVEDNWAFLSRMV